MRRQDRRLIRNAMSNAIRQARAPATPANDTSAGSRWNATRYQSDADSTISSTGNKKNARKRCHTCGSRRQFATAYAINNHGESGVQNGMYGPATVPSIGSMASAA